jgi:hypothetical protein
MPGRGELQVSIKASVLKNLLPSGLRLRLASLQRLLLNLVFLRQLLCLLSVPLLYLLRLSWIYIRTMFQFLLLLKNLPFLGLPCDEIVLLLLVFPVRLDIPGVGRRGTGNRGQVIGMDYGARRGVF